MIVAFFACYVSFCFETHDEPCDGLMLRCAAHSSHLRELRSASRHPSLSFAFTEHLMKKLTECGYSLVTTVKREAVHVVKVQVVCGNCGVPAV